MLDVHREGPGGGLQRDPRGDGARHRRRCTSTACGRPSRRTSDERRRSRRARGGRVKVRLGNEDRAVVAGLLEAVAEMLEPEDDARGTGGAAPEGRPVRPARGRARRRPRPPTPRSPGCCRTRATTTASSRTASAGSRRTTCASASATRSRLAAAALRRRAPVVLSDGEAQALLKGLTDVRLVLAERLGVCAPTRTPSSSTPQWPPAPTRATTRGPRPPASTTSSRSCRRSWSTPSPPDCVLRHDAALEAGLT